MCKFPSGKFFSSSFLPATPLSLPPTLVVASSQETIKNNWRKPWLCFCWNAFVFVVENTCFCCSINLGFLDKFFRPEIRRTEKNFNLPKIEGENFSKPNFLCQKFISKYSACMKLKTAKKNWRQRQIFFRLPKMSRITKMTWIFGTTNFLVRKSGAQKTFSTCLKLKGKILA